ncbi:MAG: PhnA domain-containing protein [Marinicellaceae bacterium]
MTNKALIKRSKSKCELCGSKYELKTYVIPPGTEGGYDESIYACHTCRSQIVETDEMDINHWRCLTDSMWNEHIPVQVMSWRMLARLNTESWAQDALDMMYLDDDIFNWAQSTGEGQSQDDSLIHKDSNGVQLASGDTVVLIKDLPVKGSSMIAKRGTAVRKISLERDNANHIVGKINGQSIVILTQYVKKS